MQIRYTKLALKDIEALRAYTATYFDVAQTNKILVLVQKAVLHSAHFPLSGRTGRVAGTRERVVLHTPFVLVYRVHKETVEIIAVIHEARQWPI